MDIRPLTPAHYEAMLSLWTEAGLSSLRPSGRDSRELVTAEMEKNPDLFLGAFDGEELIGVCIGTDDGRKGWLNRLAVPPQQRGKGVARSLIGATETALRKRGRRIIGVLIEEESEASLELFKTMGYTLHRDILYLSKRDGPEI